MIRSIGHGSARRPSRRVTAMLLAVLLNLAIIPCTMAIEVVEEGHGCCPTETKYEPRECCELADVSLDTRGATNGNDLPDLDLAPVGAWTGIPATPRSHYLTSSDPPDPPEPSVALHEQHCVYLK